MHVDEARYLALISGQSRGTAARLGRGALGGLSVAYGAVVRLRNWAYERGWSRPHFAGVPVVSLGNVTAGGTGKTPLAAFLADWFSQRGMRVGLVSRGYRARGDAGNDEKLVLEQLCPHSPHVQQKDRVAACRTVVAEHGCQLLILDDGFQHRRLARDLDIVLLDALNPFGYGRLLPRGLLREPVSSLRRADLIVITRADQASPEQLRQIRARLAGLRSNADCIEVAFPPRRLINAENESAPLETVTATPVLAFCGIGNPEGFQRTLARAGIEAELRSFPDHHHYQPGELADLADTARACGASAVLTTLKDLVKIRQSALGGIPLWAVDIGVEILAGRELLEARLEQLRARVS